MWRRAGFVGDTNPNDIELGSKPLLFPTVDGWGFTAFVDFERGRVRVLGGVARFGTTNDNGFVDARLVEATAMTCGRDVVLIALVDGSTCAFHFDDDTPRDEWIQTIPGRICDGVVKEVGLGDDGTVYALDATGVMWRARSAKRECKRSRLVRDTASSSLIRETRTLSVGTCMARVGSAILSVISSPSRR